MHEIRRALRMGCGGEHDDLKAQRAVIAERSDMVVDQERVVRRVAADMLEALESVESPKPEVGPLAVRAYK